MSIKRISDVASKPIAWLWPGRVPLGAITLLDGNGGERKSTLALNLAAKVTTGGIFFGNSIPAGRVLLLIQEDSVADTIRPRLEALGANLDHVFFFADESVALAHDLDKIEKVVADEGVSLIVADPISAFLGTGTNHEQGVRRVFAPVRAMAERNHVAIVGIRHLAKAAGSAQHAGLGSVALGAFARSGLIVARDPIDMTVILLANYKCSMAPQSPTLRIRFEGVKAHLLGESPLGANDIIRPTSPNPGKVLAEALAFLQDVLSLGAVRTKRVQGLATAAGITPTALRKARERLLDKPYKPPGSPLDGPWYWRLGKDTRIAPEVDPPDGGQLRAPGPAAPPPGAPVNTRPAADLPADEQPPDPGDDASVRFSLLELD